MLGPQLQLQIPTVMKQTTEMVKEQTQRTRSAGLDIYPKKHMNHLDPKT